jgi:hypothetical protein
LPWLLLLLSPVRNFRWWKIPIAVLIWFQFFVGAYPGNIASFAYLFLIFVLLIVFFNQNKIKSLLYWYSITVIPGLLMSGLKWIPFLISSSGPQIQNQVKVNLGIFSTIFFPYGGSGQSGDLVLPNDLTQRTFFVIPLILFLAAFARGNKLIATVGAIFLASSIILGIDFPFFSHWQENLPLMDLSRFRTIDFKPGISISLSLLAAVGLDNIITRKRLFPKLIEIKYEFLQYLLISFISISAIIMGRRVGFSNQDISVTYSWLFLSLVVFFLIFGTIKLDLQTITKGLVITTVCFIGISWADSFKDPWQVPRVPTENLYFSGNVDEIIAESQSIDLVGRPERNGPALPIPYPGEMIIQYWNSNDLKRNYSTGGYVTIKGNKNFEKYIEYALDADKSKVISFLQQGSAAIFIKTSSPFVDGCFTSKVCETEEIIYDFISYSPGNFKIRMNDLLEPTKVVVNEIGWKGWSARACDANLKCSVLKVENQDKELLLNVVVPAGTRFLTFEYVTPGLNYAWIIFWVTVLITIINVSHSRKVWITWK